MSPIDCYTRSDLCIVEIKKRKKTRFVPNALQFVINLERGKSGMTMIISHNPNMHGV